MGTGTSEAMQENQHHASKKERNMQLLNQYRKCNQMSLVLYHIQTCSHSSSCKSWNACTIEVSTVNH
jgi:hypothetical protein